MILGVGECHGHRKVARLEVLLWRWPIFLAAGTLAMPKG